MNDIVPLQSVPVVVSNNYSLVLDQRPADAIAQAQLAAQALMEIISKKKKPVMFNGEQYLEFEDWQMAGHFYGLNAKVVDTQYLELDGAIGFNARAVIYHRATGKEISAADGMCMNDEKNWQTKPLSQLKSMAQTRACGKAFRNVLSWVVVLAGYKPTPAEEMTNDTINIVTHAGTVPTPGARPMPAGVGITDPLVAEILTWLSAINGADFPRMEAHLKELTKWKAKDTGEEKFLQLRDLERVAKSKPAWIERVHKSVGKAFIEFKSVGDAQEPVN